MKPTIIAYTSALAGDLPSEWLDQPYGAYNPGHQSIIFHNVLSPFPLQYMYNFSNNMTYKNMWWGIGRSSIEIYSPYNTSQAIQIKFTAKHFENISFNNQIVKPIAQIVIPSPNLNQTICSHISETGNVIFTSCVNFTLNVTIHYGINTLTFIPGLYDYSGVGLKNLTITRIENTSS
jgi:hypothetical protein